MQYEYLSKLGVINVIDFKFPKSERFVYCTKDDDGNITSRYIQYLPSTGSVWNPAYEINGNYVSKWHFDDGKIENVHYSFFGYSDGKEYYNEKDYVDITSLIKEHNKKYKNEN